MLWGTTVQADVSRLQSKNPAAGVPPPNFLNVTLQLEPAPQTVESVVLGQYL
jgi:hypothetical protein